MGGYREVLPAAWGLHPSWALQPSCRGALLGRNERQLRRGHGIKKDPGAVQEVLASCCGAQSRKQL